MSVDDQRLTAYALGELDGAERAEVEALLLHDPEARAEVRQTVELAEVLAEALAPSPAEPSAPETGLPALDERAPSTRRTSRSATRRRRGGKGPWIAAGAGAMALAAAAAAVTLALVSPPPEPKALPTQAAPAPALDDGRVGRSPPRADLAEPAAPPKPAAVTPEALAAEEPADEPAPDAALLPASLEGEPASSAHAFRNAVTE